MLTLAIIATSSFNRCLGLCRASSFYISAPFSWSFCSSCSWWTASRDATWYENISSESLILATSSVHYRYKICRFACSRFLRLQCFPQQLLQRTVSGHWQAWQSFLESSGTLAILERVTFNFFMPSRGAMLTNVTTMVVSYRWFRVEAQRYTWQAQMLWKPGHKSPLDNRLYSWSAPWNFQMTVLSSRFKCSSQAFYKLSRPFTTRNGTSYRKSRR